MIKTHSHISAHSHKRNSRKFAWILAISVLLILGPMVYFRLTKPQSTHAGWFDDRWAFRKAVSITNSSGSDLTNFQVSIGVGTSALIASGKMKSDCSDIRITDQNGKLIPYWIEEGTNGCNQLTDTTVWTKVPSVPSTGGTVYVYYGNSSASATADGNKVFEFFDNFNRSTVDSNKWSSSGSNVIPSAAEGSLSIGSSSTVISKNPVTDSLGLGRLIFRSKQSSTNLTGGLIGFSSINSPSSAFSSGESAYLGLGTMEEKLNDFGATNLMAQYKLDETTFPEPNQFKASGYLDTGKLSQAVSIYGNSAGTNGSTLTFNRGSQISGNNYEHINTNQGTISFWIKPSWNGNDNLLHTIYDTSTDYFYIYKSASNLLYFEFLKGGITLTDETVNVSSWTAGTWYHVVVSWDTHNPISGSTYVRMVVNNTVSNMDTTPGSGTSYISGMVSYIGSDQLGKNQAQALIDDFAIYDRVLTTTEITALYNTGTGAEAGRVADPSLKFYAKMDGTGTLSPVTYNAGASASKMTSKSTELAGGTNLLANGLFELASAGLGTSWSKYNGSETTADAETASIFADTRSQKITPPDSTADYGIKQNVTVTASTNYALTGWIKSDGTHTASIVLYDTTNSLDITTTAQLGTGTTANVWTRINYAFKTNASQTALDVRVLTPTGQGATFYVDNVSLVGNILDNGGVEGTYSGGLAPSMTETDSGSRGTPSSDTDSHTGTYSQKYTWDSGANDYSWGLRRLLSGLTVGTWYILSFWYKTTATGANKFYLQSDATPFGSNIATVLPGSTSFVKYTTIRRATNDTGTFYFSIGSGASLNDSIWVDDISLTALDSVSLSLQSWTPVTDSKTGNPNPLSVQGSSTGVGTTTGVLNNAYTFNGTNGYLRQKTYDTNIGTLSFIGNDTTTAEFSDTGQNFSDYNSVGGTAPYMIVVTNSDNTTSWGYCGTANGSNLHMDIYTTKALSARGWNGTAPMAGAKTPVGYEIRKTDFQVSGALTVGAWVNFSSLYAWENVFMEKGGFGAGNTDKSWFFWYGGSSYNNVLKFTSSSDGSGGDTVQFPFIPTIGNWYFLTATKDSSNNVTLYVDGLSIGSTGSTVSFDSPGIVKIGTAESSFPFTGKIDSPFVISSALTGDQIKALYNYYTVTSSHTGTKSTPANTNSGTNNTSYHIYNLSNLSTLSNLSQDGVTLSSSTTNLPTSAQYLRVQNSDPTNNLTLDWVAVTKQASTFPTTALSSTEEQAKSPVAYWPMDEGQGTVVNDATSNRNNGTLGAGTSAPTWQTEDMCVAGKCLKYDGNDFVSIGSTALSIQTVSFWVKPTTTSQNFIDLDGGTHYISDTGGVVSATGFGTPTIYVNGRSNGTLTANQWNHIEVTTATSFNATSIKLGQRSTNFLTGFMDEVKLFSYARSAAEIKSDYNSRGVSKGLSLRTQGETLQSPAGGGSFLSEGLVGYWKMDEASWNGSANEVIDSSGNGNHGVGVGNTIPTTGAGKFGNGGVFISSAKQYTSVSDNALLSTGDVDFTICVWVKTSTKSSIMVAKRSSAGYEWQLVSDAGGSPRFYINGGGNVSAVAAIDDGNWHFICGWHDSVNNKMGIQMDIKSPVIASTIGFPSDDNSAFQIGAAAGAYLNGTIDEVRYYKRLLSPSEVRQLYEWAPGPKVYLKTDEGVGSSAFDSSGNSNNGVLNGGSWKTGKYGKGVKLNGTTDNISVPDFAY